MNYMNHTLKVQQQDMNRSLIVWSIPTPPNSIPNLKKKNGLGDTWVTTGINYTLQLHDFRFQTKMYAVIKKLKPTWLAKMELV